MPLSAVTSATCVEVTIAKLEAIVVDLVGDWRVHCDKRKDSNAQSTGNSTITHTSTGQMIHHCGVTLSEQHAAIL